MTEDVFQIVGTTQAGTFQVTRVVAEGGFAVVYRAHHQAFDADVALKCLKIPGSLSGEDQTRFLAQFREEAQLLFRLSAAIPSVVRPLQVGTLETPTNAFVPFLAMEWLDGQSLADHIDERLAQGQVGYDLTQAVRLLTPVAEALSTAHHFDAGQGTICVVHRDLKPENLFLARVSGRPLVKVLDFGIAKVRNAATAIAGHHSSSDAALSAFTPAYAAPEQWLPKRFGQSGPWTDVWGLAVTLVELVIGRTPLEGDAHAIMGAALDPERRPTPRAEGVPTSDAAERVLRRALAVDPRQRYASVADFWRDLQRAVGEAPSLAPADSLPQAELRQSSGPPNRTAPTRLRFEGDAPPGAESPGAESQGAESQRAGPRLELDGTDPRAGALAARRAPLTPPASRPTARAGAVQRRVDPGPGLLERVWAPLQLMAFAAAIKLAEYVLQQYLGQPLELGGYGLVWIYGPFFVLGLILLVVALFSAA